MDIKKVAIVTGASRGLGFAFAEKLLIDNYKIVLCSSSDQNLQNSVKELKKSYPNSDILPVPTNMTNQADVATLFRIAYETYNRIDLCINNVGFLELRSFEETDSKLWFKTIDTNLTSCYYGCHEAFKYMKRTPGVKNILNISSLSGIRNIKKFKGMSAYIASKHAIVGLTESLAVEGREYGIHVNCLAPGTMDTEMFRLNFPEFSTKTSASSVAEIGYKLCNEFGEASITGCILELPHDSL